MFYLIDVQNNTKVVEYRMVQGRREASSRTPTPASPPPPENHQRARHIRSRGRQEVPLQRGRSTTQTPQTQHGVVHRNHRKSAQQTRRRRARGRPQTRPDLVKCQRWATNESFNLTLPFAIYCSYHMV